MQKERLHQYLCLNIWHIKVKSSLEGNIYFILQKKEGKRQASLTRKHGGKKVGSVEGLSTAGEGTILHFTFLFLSLSCPQLSDSTEFNSDAAVFSFSTACIK